MYFIPKEFDFSQLKGDYIQQICFSINNIVLFLERKGSIKMEGRFTLSDEHGNLCIYETYPVNKDFGLLKLLEQRIEELNTNETRSDLIISFENGFVLKLLGEEGYESYTLNIGEDRIII
ncbi:hypothetical protein COR50_00250 [Chitinophaga caeni]|uniref:Uncharacterized protein n=1 Tax=Chitinophaga caeni TaxID=2029983 RepID=A0A291QP75_9BACT|nr:MULTISPECIES: hypothetical protein [Chitinophaga]ATL45715.1 hypothetical protein COR50_00250 [Chitinophaga caeni]